MAQDEDDEGAWIFVSHSHRDLERVREVRNILEGRGHNPLLFFLKSLSDDDELEELIKQEIEARTWFILCDSQNAQESRWVQQEIDYIKTFPDKVNATVNLGEDLDEQIGVIEELTNRTKVYMSYTRDSSSIVKRFSKLLRREEFRVFLDEEDLQPGQAWEPQLSGELASALDDGYVLAFLDDRAIQSSWVRYELNVALTHSRAVSSLVPIMLERDLPLDGELQPLRDLRAFDFSRVSARNLDEMIDEVIGWLKFRPAEV